jgi:hypothetical protein
MQPGHGTAAAAAQHAYAEVNGVRLHYMEQGKGPLILFLHGFPEFWYAWKDLLPEFAKSHHAVAVDMRGYNLSSMPESVDAYQVPILVEDVRALAEKLGAKKLGRRDCLGVCGRASRNAGETGDHQCAASGGFRAGTGEQSRPAEGFGVLQPFHVACGGGNTQPG